MLHWASVWDGLYLTQDREQGWAPVKRVMNLWVPQRAGDFLTS